ncbi:MAG: glycosyltransferase family 2 protein [Aigarchaeota archaeon]|nr:glycosyltransferase family 2 protein [Aigarchaeota archaeon]MDW8093013.1 glycosyltransferase family 2 protein [Nitrososphaerota archaeon]
MRNLSVVIPVYNEMKYIGEVLERVGSALPHVEKELIVVDDGSTDGTREWLTERFPCIWEDSEPSREQSCRSEVANRAVVGTLVVLHRRNKGKGAAIRTGIKYSRGEVIVIQDADLEYDPRDWDEMWELIDAGVADFVCGSRFHGKPHRAFYFSHFVGNKVITNFVNLLTGLVLSDVEVGYKMFKREVIDSIDLKSDDFGIEVELVVKAAKRKFRFYEVGIRYFGRTYSEGKKIRMRDGIKALWYALKYRFWD